MNYELLYKDVEVLCRKCCSNHQLYKDLTQEVMIVAIKIDNLEQRYEEDKHSLFNYLFATAYKMWNFKTSTFYRQNKKWLDFETENLEDYNTGDSINYEKELEELTHNLSEIDKKWLEEYAKRRCSINKLHTDSGISRVAITKKLYGIFKDIRNYK